ncbi:MAG: ATP-binding protein [Dysgonamonadaceae bacterium]|nr:ATP-binding protein [Dysgonamonadaceae bacterium]
MENPFVFGSATSGKWFTDRTEDSKRLLNNFTYGINTIIISPRRWGKTSLVLKVANEANKNHSRLKIVNMDIFSCRSEEDFYQLFATEIIKQTANKWEEWTDNVSRFLSGLVPKISLGAHPATDFTLSFDFSNKQLNEEILDLPKKIAQKKGIRIVVCIDEFQQITEFSDVKNFQKTLRSAWQLQTQEVTYCLYGSKKHLLSALFSKQSMPFYKFGDVLFLQKIPLNDWISYIQERFEKTGKFISSELASLICREVDNHSSYVQQLAWLLWVRTEQQATESDFNDAIQDLLNQNSALYYNFTEELTLMQMNFLRAIVDGVHNQFSRKEILSKYNLGTSANVSRVRKSLEQKELIDISPKMITFNDPVFRLWFKKTISIRQKS